MTPSPSSRAVARHALHEVEETGLRGTEPSRRAEDQGTALRRILHHTEPASRITSSTTTTVQRRRPRRAGWAECIDARAFEQQEASTSPLVAGAAWSKFTTSRSPSHGPPAPGADREPRSSSAGEDDFGRQGSRSRWARRAPRTCPPAALVARAVTASATATRQPEQMFTWSSPEHERTSDFVLRTLHGVRRVSNSPSGLRWRHRQRSKPRSRVRSLASAKPIRSSMCRRGSRAPSARLRRRPERSRSGPARAVSAHELMSPQLPRASTRHQFVSLHQVHADRRPYQPLGWRLHQDAEAMLHLFVDRSATT